jgi:hypothetical protein
MIKCSSKNLVVWLSFQLAADIPFSLRF